MTQVNIADETFIVAAPSVVAAAVGDIDRWRSWWPDLELALTLDRREKGLQWAVGGATTGSMEIWLEPFADGVILHYYLRMEPPVPRGEVKRRTRNWKGHVHRLKDELEAGREPGRPRQAVKEAQPRAD